MQRFPTLLLTASLSAVLLLSGCVSNLNGSTYSRADARAVQTVRLGTIESLRPSVQALDAYWGRITKTYGTASVAMTAALGVDDELELAALKDAQVANLEAWINAVVEQIEEAKA